MWLFYSETWIFVLNIFGLALQPTFSYKLYFQKMLWSTNLIIFMSRIQINRYSVGYACSCDWWVTIRNSTVSTYVAGRWLWKFMITTPKNHIPNQTMRHAQNKTMSASILSLYSLILCEFFFFLCYLDATV